MRHYTPDADMKLSEIAKLAGVSIATASYSLNGKAKQNGISDATAKRVKKIAREHGFVPNRTAVFLKKGRYHLFGLVAPHFTEFFSGLVEGIEKEGEKYDYHVLFSSTFRQLEREQAYLKSMIARRVDGIIIMPTDIQAKHLICLYQNDLPAIFFRHRGQSDLPYKFMSFDDVLGAYQATQHLLERGCTKIAFCSAIDHARFEYISPIHETRIQGVRQAIEEAGMSFTEDNLLFTDCTLDTAKMLVTQIKERGIDGIVGISDAALLSMMSSLRTAGIRIPEDIKLISFADTFYANYSDPPLSTMNAPKQEMGKSMVQVLIHMLETGEQENDEVLCPFELVERESSC